jgi:hypothetical protein
MELLLTVEKHFQINDNDLLVLPSIACPEAGIVPFSESVVIKRPDSSEITLLANFNVVWFDYINGGGGIDIELVLPKATKTMVPIGSQVLITPQVWQYLQGKLTVDANSIAWLEPWFPINDLQTSIALESELHKEIGKGHTLFRRGVKTIGRRRDRDEFLFVFNPLAQLALVHLTFTSRTEPLPFPTTIIYKDIEEFIEKRMKPDHYEFEVVPKAG